MIKKSTAIVLLIVIAISFLLISYQLKGSVNFGKIHFLQFSYTINSIKNFFSDVLYLREENKKLKEELYNLKLQTKSYQELTDENKRLKNLLNLKETRRDIIAIAKVIKKGSNKFVKTIWIDKGQNDGIKINMPVLTYRGLIGKIIHTADNFSEVILLTDPNFSAAVRLERTRAEGVLSGTGLNICVLKYLPLEEEVLIGDRLVTSGTDGIFPEGIMVGAVKSINKKKGLFQYIEVIPFQSELNIEEVAVIK